MSEVRILRLVKCGSALKNWGDIGVEYSKQDKAIQKVIDDLNKYRVKITISGFPECIPCRPFDGAYKCQAGTNVLYVTYNGQVYPCACITSNECFKIGHISEIDKIRQFRFGLKNNYNELCLNPIK